MPLKIGSKDIVAMYVGDRPIVAAYVGAEQVFGGEAVFGYAYQGRATATNDNNINAVIPGGEASSGVLFVAIVGGARADALVAIGGTPTIGGVNATLVVSADDQEDADGRHSRAFLYQAVVPSFAGGNVTTAVAFSSTMQHIEVHLYRFDLANSTAHNSNADGSVEVDSQTFALNIPAGGVALAGAMIYSNAVETLSAFTGLGTDFGNAGQRIMWTGSRLYESGVVGETIAVTATNSVQTMAFVGASYGPA